mgnify:FL=1
MKVLSIDCDWAITFKKKLEVIDLFVKKFKNIDTIYFAQEHHLFYSEIKGSDQLYNLDHHHDLSYNKEQKERAEDKLIEAANWVYALQLHKKLNFYFWVGNFNSIFNFKDNPHSITAAFKNFNFSHDIEDLHKNSYGKILICESKRFDNDGFILYEILKTISKATKKKIKILKTQNSQGYLKV